MPTKASYIFGIVSVILTIVFFIIPLLKSDEKDRENLISDNQKRIEDREKLILNDQQQMEYINQLKIYVKEGKFEEIKQKSISFKDSPKYLDLYYLYHGVLICNTKLTTEDPEKFLLKVNSTTLFYDYAVSELIKYYTKKYLGNEKLYFKKINDLSLKLESDNCTRSNFFLIKMLLLTRQGEDKGQYLEENYELLKSIYENSYNFSDFKSRINEKIEMGEYIEYTVPEVEIKLPSLLLLYLFQLSKNAQNRRIWEKDLQKLKANYTKEQFEFGMKQLGLNKEIVVFIYDN